MKRTTQISITMPTNLLDTLDARSGPGQRSKAVSSAVKRYLDLMAISHRNAIELMANPAQITALFEVWGNVGDSLTTGTCLHYVATDRSDSWERHGASRMATEAALVTMSPTNLAAMIDLCEIFWAGASDGRYEHPEDLIVAVHPEWRALKR